MRLHNLSAQSEEELTKQLRSLQNLADIDRYISRAGEAGQAKEVLQVSRKLAMQSLTPLSMYGLCRARWEYDLSLPSTHHVPWSEFYEAEALCNQIGDMVMKLKRTHQRERATQAAEILFLYVCMKHPDYRQKSTEVPMRGGRGVIIRITDNLPEILLPIIAEYQKQGPLHPEINYIQTKLLLRLTGSTQDESKTYIPLYEKRLLDRLPLHVRIEILFRIYSLYDSIGNKSKAEAIQDELISLVDRTWHHPVTHYMVDQISLALKERNSPLKKSLERLQRRRGK